MPEPPREVLTERRLAYMAGIVDVMGNLRLREVNHSGTSLPFVEVACPNIPLLERLAEWTGSGVTKVKRDYKRNGCTTHCPQPHVHIQSSSGRWSVSGVRATVVLYGLLPYLELQTDKAMELLQAGLVAPRKGATVGKLADLGWAIPEFGAPARARSAHPVVPARHLEDVHAEAEEDAGHH